MMVKQQYTVSFVTPAFLGDADQSGAWRTPPFKALLRQWWRVVVAKDYDYDSTKLHELREAEGRLFGNAWLENNFSQSQVKLRLDNWKNGQLREWPIPDPKIEHPEVENKKTGNLQPIGAQLYLGYGPLIFQNGNTRLKVNAAIQADDRSKLTVIFPKISEMETILQLIHWFGTLGGRSRNGWGSLMLENPSIESLTNNHTIFQAITRPLADCLQLDWPHAFATDNDGLLIWKSKKFAKTWRESIVELAKIKIAFRTQPHLIFSINKDATMPKIDYRHLLSYPVTHHGVEGWCDKDEKTGKLKTDKHGYLKQSARLANQLRFKIIKTDQGYMGLAYHLPCSIPSELLNVLTAADRAWIIEQQLDVWQKVHGILDQQMQRI